MHRPIFNIRAARPWLSWHVSWLGTALAAGLSMQPLLLGLPRGHDTLLHLYRIPLINALWREGSVFSRWIPGLVAGYGYPLFNFYPPLSAYLITTLYWLVGQNAPLALEVAFGLAIALAALAMYALGRELYSAGAATMVAVAYVLSPHLLYQVYARGSISNAIAMAMYPLAAWSILRLIRHQTPRATALAALALGALLLSHAAASLVVIGPLVIVALAASIAWSASRKEATRAAASVFVAMLLGLVVSSFFWLPALAENGLTHYLDALRAPDVHWDQNFAHVLALPEAAIAGLGNAPLPLSTGIAQLLLGTLACVCSLMLTFYARARHERASAADILTVVIGGLGLAAVLMASPVSAPVWEASAKIQQLQFPWRFLDAAVFLLSLASGRLFALLGRQRNWCPVVGLATLVLIGLNALPYMVPPTFADLPSRPTLGQVSEYERTSGALGLTSWGEYLPITVPWPLGEQIWSNASVATSLDGKARLPESVTLLSSSGDSLSAQLNLEAAEDATVPLRSFWFPGWSATIDGLPATIGPDDRGLLAIDVPAGQRTLQLHWGSTPLRRLAEGLSCIGVILSLILVSVRARDASGAEIRADQGCCTADRGSQPNGDRRLALCVATALLLFGAAKVLVLDRVDTPLVRHAEDSCPSGTTCLDYGDFAGQVRLVSCELRDDSSVVLYWRAERAVSADYSVEVALYDMTGVPVAKLARAHPGNLPTSRWSVGELVWDRYEWDPPTDALPTAYRIAVSLVDPRTGQPLPVVDALNPTIDSVGLGIVRYPVIAPDPLPDEVLTDVTYGGALRLTGAEFPSQLETGEPLRYLMRWQTLKAVPEDYTVFVHLLNDDGVLVAGNDGQPREGLYPTSVWVPGEVIVDERVWDTDAPPGEYSIEIGLYSLSTGARLLVTGSDTPAADKSEVGRIRVVND
jgi:hypothetical protein